MANYPIPNTPSTKTKWKSLPVYRMDCNGFTEPSQILHYFKLHGIKKYVYKIIGHNIPIKYGESSTDNSKQYGNRVYSQIGGLESFGINKLNRSNSKMFRELAELYQIEYNKVLNHNDVTVEIWSFDNYNFVTTDHKKEMQQAESELIQTFRSTYTAMPIGNIDDGSSSFKRPAVIASVFNQCFV